MTNIKKIDEKDFVFLNKPSNIEEDKAFSDFLKLRKNTKASKRNRLAKTKRLLS